MAVAVVNKADSTTIAGTSIVVTLPGSLVVGNWLVMSIGYWGPFTPAGLGAWTQVGFVSNVGQLGAAIYTRQIDGTEPVSYTASGFTQADDSRAATVVQLSGTGGVDVVDLTVQTDADTSWLIEDATTTVNNDLLLRMLFSQTVANTITWTWDGSTTAVTDHWSALAGGFYSHMAIRSEAQAVAGVSTPRTVTRSIPDASHSFASATIALKLPVAVNTTPGLMMMFPPGPTVGAGPTQPEALAEFMFAETTGTAASTVGPYTLVPAAGTSWDGTRAKGPFTAPLGLGPAGAVDDWSISFSLSTGASLPVGGQYAGLVCHDTGGVHIDLTAGALEVFLGEATTTLAGSILPNTAYQVTVTHAGGIAVGAVTKIYLDGAEAASTAAAISLAAVDLSALNRVGGPTTGCIAIGPTAQYAYLDDVRAFNVCLTAAQVAELSGVTPFEESRFVTGGAVGAELGALSAPNLNTLLNTASEAGMTWVRYNFDWSTIEATSGTKVWTAPDAVTTAVLSHGLKPLGVILGAPAWANGGGNALKFPTTPSQFGTFCAAVVSRYPQIRHWEIWNEPNLAPLNNDAAQYAPILQAGYNAIKGVDSTLMVLGASTGTGVDSSSQTDPRTFIDDLYDTGFNQYFDHLSCHAYTWPFHPNTVGDWNTFTQLWDIRARMVAGGDTNKKIWVTECGAPTGTHTNAVTEANQAIHIDYYISTMRNYDWFGPTFVYSVHDRSLNLPVTAENFGIVKFDYSHKAAFAVVQGYGVPQAVTNDFPLISGHLIGGAHDYNDPTYQAQIARLDMAIIQMYRGWQVGGKTPAQAVNEIKAINPNILLGNYTLMSEVYTDTGDNATADMRAKLNSGVGPGGVGNWWAYDAAGNHVDFFAGVYGTWEVNSTIFVTPDSNGDRWPQWCAKRDQPQITGADFDIWYCDANMWYPRGTADWNRDGTNDLGSNDTVRGWYRDGQRAHYDMIKTLQPSKLLMINADNDLDGGFNPGGQSYTQFKDVAHGALMEHVIGLSWSYETNHGWAGMMGWYRRLMGNLLPPKIVQFEIDMSANVNDYQKIRYGFGACLMDNGYFAATNTYQRPVLWYDEYDLAGTGSTKWLGAAIDPPQLTAWSLGVYRRRFENGMVLVNPKGNGARTVTPDSGYKRFLGTQAPSINNGAAVTSTVTLADRDGLFLVKI